MMSCPKGWEETRVIIIFFLLKKSPVSCLTCLTSCFTWHMLSVTNANSHSHRPSHCYWLASIATSRDWKENCTSRLHLYITRRGLEPKHLWYCRVCYVRGASPGGSGGLGVFCRQSYELAWLLYNWHIIIRALGLPEESVWTGLQWLCGSAVQGVSTLKSGKATVARWCRARFGLEVRGWLGRAIFVFLLSFIWLCLWMNTLPANFPTLHSTLVLKKTKKKLFI